MTTKSLTRKIGPAPLWVWLAVGLAGVYLLYRHTQAANAASTNSTPVTVSSGAPGVDAASPVGSDVPTDSGGNDLLAALQGLTGSYSALDAALAGVSAGGGGSVGGVPASGGGGSSSTGAAFATVDPAATASAPSGSTFATTANSNPYSYPAILSGGQTNDQLPASEQLAGAPSNAYVIGGPAQVSAPVASPTPTLVQPSPVDSSQLVAPTGGGGGRPVLNV